MLYRPSKSQKLWLVREIRPALTAPAYNNLYLLSRRKKKVCIGFDIDNVRDLLDFPLSPLFLSFSWDLSSIFNTSCLLVYVPPKKRKKHNL